MGISCSSNQVNDKSWKIQHKSINKTVLYNAELNFKVEQNKLVASKVNVKNNLAIIKWRIANQGNNNILQVYSYKIVSQKNGINNANGEIELNIYTQLLMNITHYAKVKQSKKILLLKNFIQGAYILQKKFGYFRVTANMLGINHAQVGKIWLNENFAANQQKKELILSQNSIKQNEKLMINDILAIMSSQANFQYRSQKNTLEGLLQQLENIVDEKKENEQDLINGIHSKRISLKQVNFPKFSSSQLSKNDCDYIHESQKFSKQRINDLEQKAQNKSKIPVNTKRKESITLQCSIYKQNNNPFYIPVINSNRNLSISTFHKKHHDFKINKTVNECNIKPMQRLYLNSQRLDLSKKNTSQKIFGNIYYSNCNGYLVTQNTFPSTPKNQNNGKSSLQLGTIKRLLDQNNQNSLSRSPSQSNCFNKFKKVYKQDMVIVDSQFIIQQKENSIAGSKYILEESTILFGGNHNQQN